MLTSDVLRQIGTLSRSIHSINDIQFKKYDLQRNQFIFLTRICEHAGINQISLSALLKVDKATTTKAVQKLIKAGYIEKRRNDEDRREWNLYPLERARQVYEAIIAEENRAIGLCLAGFTDEEKAAVSTLIRRMSRNIEEEWKKFKSYKV